jgi:glycosyltransferase involved in cell wall biosynthesis
MRVRTLKKSMRKRLLAFKSFIYTLPVTSLTNWTNCACHCQEKETDTLWPWNRQVEQLPPTMNGKPWPKISIITPSYNQGHYIEETIRSVLLQSYPNLEYIVVDGGSTDNTLNILKRYQSEINVCISETDNGQSHALNKGFRLATGEILAWLNSDDLYFPNTLRDVALAFDSQDVEIVVGGCQTIKNFSRIPIIASHHCILPMNKMTLLPFEKILDFQGSWLKGDFFFQPEVFWTKQIWDKVGGRVDEKLHFAMDYELWLRLAKAKARVLHIPKNLAVFRIHNRQKTILSLDIANCPEHTEVAREFQEGLRP